MSDKKIPIGQTSVDVIELVAILVAAKPGDILSYKDMTKQVGRDVQVDRHLLASARRIAMRDHNAVFAAVISHGIKRLDDVETVTICSEVRRGRIRTQARNGIKELSTVNFQALDTQTKTQHNVGIAMMGTLYESSSRKAVRRLEAKVMNAEPQNNDGILKEIGWTKS